MPDIASTVALVGILIFLAHLFTGIFSRTRIPDVFLLIIIGICAGPVFNLISPAEFGVVGPVFTTITMVILLFENGLSLKLAGIRNTIGATLKLAPLSFILTVGGVAGLAMLLTDLTVLPAFTLGAIVGSTTEAILIPLLRKLKIQDDTMALLTVESSINDVLSIVITVALVQASVLGQVSVMTVTGDLFSSFTVALVFGIGGALIWSALLHRVQPLKNAMFTTPAFVFVIYGLVEVMGFSGAVATLSFGITIGNIEKIHFPVFRKAQPKNAVGLTQAEKSFFSEVAFLLKSFFFIYIGISLELISRQMILLSVIFCLLIFILRLFAVKVAVNKSLPKLDISIVSVIIPKGLAAVVLATLPLQYGMAGGETIKYLTYGIVLASIVLTAFMCFLIEKTKVEDVFSWVLSSRFPRLSPRVITRPKEMFGSTGTLIPGKNKLFKGVDELKKIPITTEKNRPGQ